MGRFVAGIAAFFTMLTGAFLLWQARGDTQSTMPPPPPPGPQLAATVPGAFRQNDTPRASAPEATPKSREERRFSRADKDKDGRVESEEIYAPRRKAYAKLDTNGNGSLSFEEWADKTRDKFVGADKDRSGWLTAAEYASTAPPPPKRKARCGY